MAMKMKKIDLSGLKDFLFQKGERVGLVLCGLIAVLLLGMGFMKALNAGTNFAKEFKDIRSPLDKMLAEVPPDKKVPEPERKPVWVPVLPTFPEFAPFTTLPDQMDTKARNPEILPLPLMEDTERMKIEYYAAGVYTYDLGKNEVSVYKKDKKTAIKNMKPVRMVVVTTVLPMKSLWEEYRQQLIYLPHEDLTKEDQPKALGLVVYRCEIKDGKPTPWEPVYNEKSEPVERLLTFFKEVYYDTVNVDQYKDNLQRGLVTPLPLLANKKYEKVELKGIKEYTPPTVMTKPPTGQPPLVDADKMTFDAFKALDPFSATLAGQFQGKIDFFEASGLMENPDGTTPPRPGGRPSRYGFMKLLKQGLAPTASGTAGQKKEVFDQLVRFIDIGVEPGKTYQYTFRVRFANPNFEKKDEVSYVDLADVKELLSPDAYSPPITIPEEYFYYAADQHPSNEIVGGSDAKLAKAEPPTIFGLWNTPVQIHRWVTKYGEDHPVADWAIAERLLVRRGDPIGRTKVMVEVPEWDKAHQAFKIGYDPQALSAKVKTRATTGLPLNFRWGETPPLLVDFDGGIKHSVKVGKNIILKDEAAVEILVLTPEGTLTVRNSGLDSDSQDPQGNPEGKARHDRWFEWEANIQKLRRAWTGAPAGGVPGFNMPGFPMGK